MSCHRFDPVRCRRPVHFPVTSPIVYTIIFIPVYGGFLTGFLLSAPSHCLTIPDASFCIPAEICSPGKPKSIPDEITIDKDSTPVCQAGYRMVYWGYCPGATGANGAARWPVAKWVPARARVIAQNPHMGIASIRNLTGMRAFIRPLPGARGNTKKSIKTAHLANG